MDIKEEFDKTIESMIGAGLDLSKRIEKYFEEFQKNIDEAYKRGMEEGYKRGLAAGQRKKITEAKDEPTEDIERGDEVEHKVIPIRITVTSLRIDGHYSGFDQNGLWKTFAPEQVRKTGKHYDIDKILEEMRKGLR